MQPFVTLDSTTLDRCWLTIGTFDGVHLGHQCILDRLTGGAHASGSPAAVLTFFPHPAVVLRKRSEALYLNTLEERAALLKQYGADIVIAYPFTLETAAKSAFDFIEEIHRRLHFSDLVVGHDFALGRGREGNLTVLSQIGEQLGYRLHEVAPLAASDEIISSSQVRLALRDGDLDKVQRLLGRPYEVSGRVIQGDGRGRTIGVPTANLETWAELILPKPGIYTGFVHFDGVRIGAVTNVGYRPTFEPQPALPLVEVHLLDFEGDLYGKRITFTFQWRLRDEIKFDSVTALVAQIQQDIAQSRELLEREGSGSRTSSDV
jgi:riboflavin kinase/FMN adenylyltransferase